MVDSYLFGGSQSIALVALEVIFWTYTDLNLEKFRVQLSGGAADWDFIKWYLSYSKYTVRTR